MEKTYIYTTEKGGARGVSQSANDMIGIQHFNVLFKDDFDKLPPDNISKRFFSRDGKFSFDSFYSDIMHKSLVKIKENWKNIKNTKTAQAIHEFMSWAGTTSENLQNFLKYYTSNQNNVYIYAERIFAGLASIGNGNQYTIGGKTYVFDDDKAAAEFNEFAEKQKPHYMPEGYRDGLSNLDPEA